MIKRIKQFLRRKESKKRAEIQREKDIRFKNQMLLSKEYGKNEN